MASTVFGITLGGGLDSDSGPSAPLITQGDGFVAPYLLRSDNVVYSRDGWPRKMPGARRVNAISTGAQVDAIFDYWRSTTSTAPVQQVIAASGTDIYSLSGAVLTSIKSSIQAASVFAFEVFDDDLVIATDNATDPPWKWNQTTFANLGGTPPQFSFMVQHKGRMFAAGVNALKSRLYYTAASTAEDWVGAGSGSLDVTPDDGDVITGLASYKDELVIFKGPYTGRIVRLTGSSPSDFALVPFIRGIGSVGHRSIVPLNDDLLFWDRHGLHSLKATASYGDFAISYLTDPIRTYLRDNLWYDGLDAMSGVNIATEGYAVWNPTWMTHPDSPLGIVEGAASVGIMMDYRFSPPRFASWPAMDVACLAMVKGTAGVGEAWAGSYDGFLLGLDHTKRTFGGVAYGMTMTLPYLSFGEPFADKMALKGRVGYKPRSATSFSVRWRRDNATGQTATLTQTDGVDTLAASDSQFILDSSTLGGPIYAHNFFDMSGQFKELQLSIDQIADPDADLEIHSLALDLAPAGKGTTRILG